MSRDEMILNNLGLARKVARRYSNDEESRCTFEEYLSVCYEGLIKAVDSYDKSMGIKFSTFATRCCINEVYDLYNRDSWYNYKQGEQLEKQHTSLNISISMDGDEKEELIQQVKDNSIVEFDKFWVKDFIESVVSKSMWEKNKDRNTKIILLRVFDGLTFEQIAKECNISERQAQLVMDVFKKNATNSKILYSI